MLVVVAAGGAGLAVRADQLHDAAHRPELSGPSDAHLQPWLPAIDERLKALDERLFDLSSAGTDLLGAYFSLDSEAALAAADDGDAASAATGTALQEASVVRDGASAAVEQWRLSPPNRQRLSLSDTALESSRGLTAAWAGVSADARLAAGVLEPLAAHADLLTEATDKGREARWRDAVRGLDAAAGPLAEASAAVGRLPQSLNVARMETLLAAYGEYDEALRALYEHIRRTGSVKGADVEALLARVELLQAQVPMDRLALGEVVVGALGQGLTDAVEAMERAGADIFDALPGEELDTPDQEIEPGAFETDDGVEP